MATKVTLPLLGQTMEEGTIIKWFKKEGETVEKEEPLLEVMTDKANMEVESPASGVLLKIIAKEDDTIPVKALIGVIGEAGEDISGMDLGQAAAAPAAEEKPKSAKAAEEATPTGQKSEASAIMEDAGGRVLASPRARKLAEDAGLDLSAMAGKGSGPNGRIIEKDVQKAIAEGGLTIAAPPASPLAQKIAADQGVSLGGVQGSGPGGKIYTSDVQAASAPAAAPAPTLAPRVDLGKTIPFAGLRKAVADNMVRSKESVVPVTLTLSVDMTEATKLREQIKPVYEKNYGVKLGFTDIIIKATAKAIEAHAIINSTLDGNQIKVHDGIHINVAVAVPDGLYAPVVKDANLKPMWAISNEIKELAGKAREGKLGGADLTGGTFTLTNLGAYGIEHFNAIINPGQAAILAVCAIKDEAVVVNKQVEVRPKMNLCLTFDHRILDGAPAAAFLAHLRELLESPYLFLA